MPKNKERSELEHLRGENRRLRKLLKYYKKRAHFNEHEDVEDEEEPINTCPSCGKGELLVHDWKYIIIETCNTCSYEKKIKI